MKRRADNASLFDESYDPSNQGYSSNMKLMMIIAAFLIVTIGLILLQPETQSRAVSQNVPEVVPTDTKLAETIVPTRPVEGISTNPILANEVTRTETSLLSLASEEPHIDVSQRLRHPIRLDGHHHDIREMSREALSKFGKDAVENDKLYSLLVQSLAEGQSDAYIDALLNTLASKGEIKVPVALQMASGRLNTEVLLHALAEQCNH